MTDKTQKLEKLKTQTEKTSALSAIHPDLPMVDALDEINSSIKELVAKETPEKDVQKVEIQGAEVVTIKGEKGDMPTDEKIIEIVTPIIKENIPEPIPGKDAYVPKKNKDYFDGYTPVKGKDYFDGKDAPIPDIPAIVSQASAMTEARLLPFIPKIEDIEKDLPKLSSEIRDSLELLPKGERLDIKYIDGVDDRLKGLETFMNKPISMASIAGRDIIKDIDISASLDGVTTTFQLQAIWNIVSVSLSSYPYGSLRKGIDYSFTPTSISFLSPIDPVTQLSAGQQAILTVVQS